MIQIGDTFSSSTVRFQTIEMASACRFLSYHFAQFFFEVAIDDLPVEPSFSPLRDHPRTPLDRQPGRRELS